MNKQLLYPLAILILLVVIVLLITRKNTQETVAENPVSPTMQTPEPVETEKPADVESGLPNVGDFWDKAKNIPAKLPIPNSLPSPANIPLPTNLPTSTDSVSDVFDFGKKVLKSGDDKLQGVVGLTTAEEIEWGREFHRYRMENEKAVHNEAVKQRIARLAAPLLERRERKELNYTFTVLASKEINACSIVGGYVYLNQGLMDVVKSDEELQFVIGHEIGHVEQRHCAKKVTYALRASKVGTAVAGKVVSEVYSRLSTGYTQDDEFEADAWAFRHMQSLGHSRPKIVSAVRQFADSIALAYGAEAEEKAPKSVVDALRQELEYYCHSHPLWRQRIARLENDTSRSN